MLPRNITVSLPSAHEYCPVLVAGADEIVCQLFNSGRAVPSNHAILVVSDEDGLGGLHNNDTLSAL